MRKQFEMSEEQLEALLDAGKPVMLIALQCGHPKSPQENSNTAWQRLGDEMGFDYLTAEPCAGRGNRFFTAIKTH